MMVKELNTLIEKAEKDCLDQNNQKKISWNDYFPKNIMLDLNLKLEEKAIMCYFIRCSGNETKDFPGRDKIISDLHISINTFYNYRKKLIEAGYLTVNQTNEHKIFEKTVYTISHNNKIPNQIPTKFDYVSELVMTDSSLSLKSKGLFEYLCCCTGIDDICFPKKETILYYLNIGETTFRKCLNELIAHNYIFVKQRKTNGRFGANNYYINYSLTPTLYLESKKSAPEVHNKNETTFVSNDTISAHNNTNSKKPV